MTASGAEARGAPAPGAATPRWPWVFGLIFVSLTASAAWFATRPVPLARRMDASRSSLVADGPARVRVRILVLGVPEDGEIRAVPHAPQGPAERWRVDVEWTAEPAARVPTPGGERLFDVALPAAVQEVEVWDRRGGLAPERMLLTLAPEPGR
jgi:hypothetical protein